MANLIKMEKLSLKNNPNITEDLIQSFIFEDASVLGLGDLTPIKREKIQPSGGRLDLLFEDSEGTRYEVEVQLGATDPSHIIRTIEYWDLEKKRYPQYDHCAVIVAEEITGRFMNVISLFNGNIPLIALQLSAHKLGDDICLTFTKVIDRVTLGTDEEEQYEVTDRNYWDKRSTSSMLKNVDEIFDCLKEFIPDYELKYNKFYIGLAKNNVAKNFVFFKPKKSFLYLCIKGNEYPDLVEKIENSGLDITYHAKWKEYYIKLKNAKDYKLNRENIDLLVKESMQYYNVIE